MGDGVVEGINTFFLLFAGALVFMMQAGFAMLCAGSVRQKNVKNIMLKNLLDACGGAVGFYTLGYGFAYGSSSTFFIGTSNFAIKGFTSGPELIGFFFQFAFAATAATIVAGTVAERCKMAAYLCYSLFLTAFVYPVVVRSIWSSDGFLTAFKDEPFRGVGMIDFAGSGVVHMTVVQPLLWLPSFLDHVAGVSMTRTETCSKHLPRFLLTLSLFKFLVPSSCGLDGTDLIRVPPWPLPTLTLLQPPHFALLQPLSLPHVGV